MSVVGGFPFTFLGGDFPGIMGVEPCGKGGGQLGPQHPDSFLDETKTCAAGEFALALLLVSHCHTFKVLNRRPLVSFWLLLKAI